MDKEIVDQSVVVEPSPHAETPDAPSETLPPTGGAPMNEMIQLLRLTSMQGPLAQIKKEKKPMAKVSIPGMSTVFGDASPCRRVVWTLVLLVCFSIATIQLKDRVEHYMSTPVTVNVRVTMNNSLRFPALTVCNKNSFNMTQFNLLKQELAFERNLSHHQTQSWGLRDLIGFRGMDAKQLWDSLAHNPNKIILECWFGRGIRCEQVGEWKKVYTYMGVCYSYILNKEAVETTGLFNNLYLLLMETESILYKEDNGWKILVHDREQTPIIDIRTHGSTLHNGWGKDIRIYIRQFETLNTWNHPCSKEGRYSHCIVDCFVKTAAASMSCRLPYMDVVMDYCATTKSYEKHSKKLHQQLFYGQWSSSQCSCQRQCDENIYVTSSETFQMEANETKLSKLRLFYQDFTFDEIIETADYGLVSLLCDIGGSLGFLLGVSVLTLFEIVDAVTQAVLKLMAQLISKCRR